MVYRVFPRGKVLRTPPLRHPSYPVHTPSLRELNPSPRIEISWGSDEVPDDTILERTVLPSESAPAVEIPVEHVQPPDCESVTAERLNTTAEDILVASLDSSAVVDSDITTAVSAAVPVQRTESAIVATSGTTTQSTSCTSISAADSAPLRSVHFAPSVDTPGEHSVVTCTVTASGSALPCVSSVAQPRETGLEPRNSAREWPWGTSLARRPDPTRASQDTRFPPSMSFLSGSLGDARGGGTSGLDSECSRNPRNPTDDMSTERIAERTVEIVRDLSTMLGGRRDQEVDYLVKSISSDITSLVRKREMFQRSSW